jgi:hypothetical protein
MYLSVYKKNFVAVSEISEITQFRIFERWIGGKLRSRSWMSKESFVSNKELLCLEKDNL